MPYAKVISRSIPHPTNGNAVRNALRIAMRRTRTLYTFQEFQLSWPSTADMLERLTALVGAEILSPFNQAQPYIEHALIDLHNVSNKVVQFDCQRVHPSPLRVDAALMLVFCTRLIRLALPVTAARIGIKNGVDTPANCWDWQTGDFTDFRANRSGSIEVRWDDAAVQALRLARQAATQPEQADNEAEPAATGKAHKRVRYHGRGRNTPTEIPQDYQHWLCGRFDRPEQAERAAALFTRLLGATDLAILSDIVRDHPRAAIPRSCL